MAAPHPHPRKLTPVLAAPGVELGFDFDIKACYKDDTARELYILEAIMGVMAREGKLNISAPILTPFTHNLLYEVSLSSPKLKKKRGFKAWARSKSWRYWVFLGMIVVFFCLACASLIFVLTYLIPRHRPPPPPNGATSALNGTTPAVAMSYVYGGHSYLIDVESGEDENARAAVGFLFRDNELTLESGSYHRTSG